MCLWLQGLSEQELNKIAFTDEATFCLGKFHIVLKNSRGYAFFRVVFCVCGWGGLNIVWNFINYAFKYFDTAGIGTRVGRCPIPPPLLSSLATSNFPLNRRWSKQHMFRGVNKDSVEGGLIFWRWRAKPKIFLPPPPRLVKYHDVYQIIGFSWVWFEFSTYSWHLQTPSNKGFISYFSAFTCHYSHSFYINYKDL